MTSESSRVRAMDDRRARIVDVALEVLGSNPEAGMGEIASAAGVVRRTVYGYFPTRADLVRHLTQRAVSEISGVLTEINTPDSAPDEVWAEFVEHLWPLAHRYRVLLALRRGEHGAEIHAMLGEVDATLADLVQRGQSKQVFGRHLPAGILSQIAFSAVFSIADGDVSRGVLSARAATVASLLILGVPEARATTLAGE